MTVTTLQTILITALIATWLVFSIVFLISSIQSFFNDRKRENFDSSLPNPLSRNIRRWSVRSVMTAGLAACSLFTVLIVPDAGQAGLYNYKTSHKIISRIWPTHALL